jgi:CHAT domain-containing protein/Tfp pilus assembly protein PilF
MATMQRLWIAALVFVSTVFGQNEEAALHADSVVAVKLAGGAKRFWTISLPEGQTANLEIVEQQGLAGILSVAGADGGELVEADLRQRSPAAKSLLIPPGANQIRIQAADHGPLERAFEFRIGAFHAPTDQDRLRIQAEQMLGQGEKLRRGEEQVELEPAAGLFEKALALWERLEDTSRQADTLLHLGGAGYALGHTKPALNAYQRALDLWTARADRAGVASAFCNIAEISFETGQQKLAEEDARQCLEIERERGDQLGLASALIVEGQLHAAHGQNEQVRADYREAMEAARRGGDRIQEAEVIKNLAIFEDNLAQWQESREDGEKALAIARAEGDRHLMSRCLNDLASFLMDTGDLRKAVGYLEEALPLRKTLSAPNSYATSLYNLANAHAKLDDYDKARAQFAEAMAIFQQTGFARGQGYVLTALGHLALNTGDEEKAEAFFRQAQVQWRVASDRQGEVFALNALGDVAARRGQFRGAIELHRQALGISRADNLPREEDRTLGYLADAYDKARDARSSLEQASLELDVIRKIGDPEGEARALYQQGRAWRALREYDRAQEALNKALELDRSLGTRTREADALYELAALDGDRGRLQEANAKIAKALDIVDATGAGAGSAESRMLFAASHRKSYDLAIDLAMRLHDNAKAFELSERARARTFVDLIRGARLDIRQGVDPALLDREQSIQESLNEKQERLTRLLASSPGTGSAAQAKKEIDGLVEKYEAVEAEIRRTSPRYAALLEPHTLSLTDVQSELPDSQTALAEFWLGEERSYAWLVTKTACRGFELPARQQIEALARRAYSALTARNLIRDETSEQMQSRVSASDREFAQVSAELSRMLLGKMTGLSGARLLWVVSDGALEYLPFAALPTPGSSAPLVASHRIARLPSASVLAEVRQQLADRQPAPRAVAVFADPVFQKDDERVVKSNDERVVKSNDKSQAHTRPSVDVPRGAEDVDLASLPRLWFSRREADAVAALAPRGGTWEALDFDASRTEAQKPALADYRVLHFATHAFLDSRHPELSGLVLSMVDRAGRPQDGFLRLNEIYNLKLNADLVVLSGCQTALGQEVRSEGLVGLTRGFMYAGAPRVLASLWDVRDRATAEFMSRFYEPLLRRHLPPEDALRSAQLAMMNDPRWSQPYYWAAFTMQGAQ